MTKNLILRFQPIGKKHNKFFRVVVAQKYRAASKLVIETLGWYNPYTKETSLNIPKIQEYIAQNVEISESVSSLLKKQGILKTA